MPCNSRRKLGSTEAYKISQAPVWDVWQSYFLHRWDKRFACLFDGFPVTLQNSQFLIPDLDKQYSIAPRERSWSTSVELAVAGFPTKHASPIEESFPLSLKLSFNEIGRPCSGLSGHSGCSFLSSSRAFALAMASSKNISVKQLT